MELQEIFYIMGIVYMTIMFALMIVIVAAILVIKHKVNSIQQHIEEKLATVTNAIHMGEAIVDKAKETFGRKK